MILLLFACRILFCYQLFYNYRIENLSSAHDCKSAIIGTINIRRIDRQRAGTREILTGKQRGDGSSFDLTVNTTGWEIHRLTEALADFALRRFEE